MDQKKRVRQENQQLTLLHAVSKNKQFGKEQTWLCNRKI
jgi:hypothetical protein